MQRRMLVERNPLLRDAEILFVKRYTYNSKHYYDDFQHISRLGRQPVRAVAGRRPSPRDLVPQLAAASSTATTSRSTRAGSSSATAVRSPRAIRIYEIGVDGARPAAGHDSRRTTKQQRIAKYGKTSYRRRFLRLAGIPVLDRRRAPLLPARRRPLLRLHAMRTRRAVHAGTLPGLHEPVPHGRRRQRPAADLARAPERVHADHDGRRADSLQPLGIRLQGHRRRAAAVDHAAGRLGQRRVLRRQHRQSRRVLAGPPGARPSATWPSASAADTSRWAWGRCCCWI